MNNLILIILLSVLSVVSCNKKAETSEQEHSSNTYPTSTNVYYPQTDGYEEDNAENSDDESYASNDVSEEPEKHLKYGHCRSSG